MGKQQLNQNKDLSQKIILLSKTKIVPLSVFFLYISTAFSFYFSPTKISSLCESNELFIKLIHLLCILDYHNFIYNIY